LQVYKLFCWSKNLLFCLVTHITHLSLNSSFVEHLREFLLLNVPHNEVIVSLHIRLRTVEVLLCPGKKMKQSSVQLEMKILHHQKPIWQSRLLPIVRNEIWLWLTCDNVVEKYKLDDAKKKKIVHHKFKVCFSLFKDRKCCVEFHGKSDPK
jgi:hypothetical protein